MLPGAKDFIKQLFSWVIQKTTSRRIESIFDNNYIKSKTYFLQEFGKTPCASFINNLDEGRPSNTSTPVMPEKYWLLTKAIITVGSKSNWSLLKPFLYWTTK
jgi:hypothetical protein